MTFHFVAGINTFARRLWVLTRIFLCAYVPGTSQAAAPLDVPSSRFVGLSIASSSAEAAQCSPPLRKQTLIWVFRRASWRQLLLLRVVCDQKRQFCMLGYSF